MISARLLLLGAVIVRLWHNKVNLDIYIDRYMYMYISEGQEWYSKVREIDALKWILITCPGKIKRAFAWHGGVLFRYLRHSQEEVVVLY